MPVKALAALRVVFRKSFSLCQILSIWPAPETNHDSAHAVKKRSWGLLLCFEQWGTCNQLRIALKSTVRKLWSTQVAVSDALMLAPGLSVLRSWVQLNTHCTLCRNTHQQSFSNAFNLVIFHLLLVKTAISQQLSCGGFNHVKNYCVIWHCVIRHSSVSEMTLASGYAFSNGLCACREASRGLCVPV